MKHKEEIKYWAEQPDGTKVWERYDTGDDWIATRFPDWDADKSCIVDNQWAELRKSQADGKQLQWVNPFDEWEDSTLTLERIKKEDIPEDWMVKAETFEIKYKTPVYVVGANTVYKGDIIPLDDKKAGRCRTTIEEAEYSFERNRKANRLEALAMYIGGLYEPLWDGVTAHFFVYYHHMSKSWEYAFTVDSMYPEVVYMTRSTAKKVCDILNSGEYDLMLQE